MLVYTGLVYTGLSHSLLIVTHSIVFDNLFNPLDLGYLGFL